MLSTAGPLVVCAAAAVLYALGGRGRTRAGRETAFYGGLVSMLVVLEPPFDGWAGRSFALHMTQHVVLMTVTAPLIVLGRPWPRLWVSLPLAARRTTGRRLARSSALALSGRVLRQPMVSLALMSASLGVWHVPVLYDLAVRNEGAHLLEHAFFLGTSLLWWGSLLEAPPVRARIDHLRRTAWLALALLPSWTLAIVLGFASTPLYSAYVTVPHRLGGLGALADQQLAAGVMWVPGSFAYTIAAALAFYRWLGPDSGPRPRTEELSWT
ncbi:MAG: cytochrome c oxidase assembly protein [Gaiellaceae bacterium]